MNILKQLGTKMAIEGENKNNQFCRDEYKNVKYKSILEKILILKAQNNKILIFFRCRNLFL